jgi:hypothetical protein
MEELQQIRVLNLCEDDTLVFKFENVLSPKAFDDLNKDIRSGLDGLGIKNKFLILDSNCSLEIIRKTSYHIQVESKEDAKSLSELCPELCQMNCAIPCGEKT